MRELSCNSGGRIICAGARGMTGTWNMTSLNHLIWRWLASTQHSGRLMASA